MSRGYIYVIEDEPNTCKIGKTKNSIRKRNVELSTTFHREFKIRGFFESNDIHGDEQFIHYSLKEYRIRGEWFKITYEEIVDKLSKLYKFENYVYVEKQKTRMDYKLTFNVNEDTFNAFNEIYAQRMLEGRKTDKSVLICEAIRLLYESEKEKRKKLK